MAFADHVQLFLMLMVGIVLSVGVTLLILRRKGLIDHARSTDQDIAFSQGLFADPRLDALSAQDRRLVIAQVRWHPTVLLWVFSTLVGIVWVATGSTELIDFVNGAPRGAAFVIGFIVLAIVFIGLKILYRWLIGRAIRRLTPD
jgi:nitrate reductase gamma subunit